MDRRPRPKSLALPSGSGLSGHVPTSILKGGYSTHSGAMGGDHSAGDILARSAALQNRFDDESSAYKRRLETYRQAQHQQALLVARLQSKLLQYKQRCSDLETKLGQTPILGMEPSPYHFGSPTRGGLPDFPSSVRTNDLEEALWKLDQERLRNESLVQMTRELRHELEETRKVNNALSTDLTKLSDDWDKLTKQMGERENMWRSEEQAYSDYYASEHTKLLALWKRVAATKRDFAEMKASTGRDMAQLRNNLARLSNQVTSGVISAAVASPPPHQDAEQTAFLAQLSQELTNSQNTQENLRRQVKDREEKIVGLENTISEADARSRMLEVELNRVSTQELGLLNSSLREIGKLLINDFDQHGLEEAGGHGHDLHLTSNPTIFIYDENGENPTVFAESIVSAVQAALNKRHLQIHQLQVNLSSAKEQSLVARGHVESLETEMNKAEEKIQFLSEANEKIKDALESVKIEKENAQRVLDNLKGEKNILEQQRKATASELETTLKIKNNVSTTLAKLEKSLETSREELDNLHLELEKTKDELLSKSGQLKMEQELSQKLREQLSHLGEDKERNLAENKAIKNSLSELTSKYEDISFQFEKSEDSLKKWKSDAEILVEKLRSATERGDLAEKEKKKVNEKNRTLEQTKAKVEAELTDSRNDLASLRRELLDSERVRTDLEAKIENLAVRADAAENKKSVLEVQIDSQRDEYMREMALMGERTEFINEELNNTRRELEDTLQVLDRLKGDLSNSERLHMDAVHMIEAKENDVKNLSNSIDKLQNEKNSLEELEETLKTMLIEKDKRIESLERQMVDLKGKMNAEVSSLRDRCIRLDREGKIAKEKYDQEKLAIESKYSKELATLITNSSVNEEKLKKDSEDKLKNLRADLEGSKKADVNKLNSEISTLRSQIDSARVQYEEALLRAENDKQQGLLLAQQDQQGLSDKIRLLERELEDLKTEKERIKRECEAKCNHEKNSAAGLRSELIKIKNELETTRQEGTESLKAIETRLGEIEREREGALMAVEDLRSKLRSAEEREGELKRDLADIGRKLKESDNSSEKTKKELLEARRTLGELAVEKERTSSNMENLKDELNRRDSEMILLKKELSKIQGRAKDLEKIKGSLEDELAGLSAKLDGASREKTDTNRLIEELNDQISQSRMSGSRLDAEIAELKMKLEGESERRDTTEAQYRTAKKLLEEAENHLNCAKSEEERLSLKLAETEERYGAREAQFIGLAEESKMREKKLIEEKHNLNLCLASIQQNMEQMNGKLISAENRLKTLSEEKERQERLKKEAESKLNQIQSGFKRLGISSGSMENPEAARRVMATLQTQMAALQQDRDTLAAQLASTKEALTTAELAKTSLEDQFASLNRSIQSARGDIKSKDSQIFALEKDLALKGSEISRLAEKVRETEDALKNKEDQIRLLRTEKDTGKDDLEKTRLKLEENRHSYDSKWAKAEVNMRALEGDLNRMALVLQQKDGHITSIEDKCALVSRTNTELEERCASLTMTVEQLNISLEKSEQDGQDWREKCNGLSRNSVENTGIATQLQEKLRSLQREKALLEQDRNNLTDKWEGASSQLQEFKRQVSILAEKNQKLRQQTEDMTRNAIDKQLKMALAESGKEDMRQILSDKLELQRRVDSLIEKVRDLERENRELERMKEVPMKGSRQPMPVIRDNAMSVLEEENSELRRKISKLEAEIRDLERRHTKHIGEVTSQVKQERDFELERARAAKLQAERLLEARESNYRQQIQRLEQQVVNLKEQLGEEIRRRQSFLSRSFRTGQEIRSLRQALGDSLRNVSMDPNTIENETRRLDSTLDLHKSASQRSMSPMGRERDPSPAMKSGHK